MVVGSGWEPEVAHKSPVRDIQPDIANSWPALALARSCCGDRLSGPVCRLGAPYIAPIRPEVGRVWG